MLNPNPVPSGFVVKKGSKMVYSISFSIPAPLSAIRMVIVKGVSFSAVIDMVPFPPENDW